MTRCQTDGKEGFQCDCKMRGCTIVRRNNGGNDFLAEKCDIIWINSWCATPRYDGGEMGDLAPNWPSVMTTQGGALWHCNIQITFGFYTSYSLTQPLTQPLVLSTHRNSWKHLGWPALRSLRTSFMPRRGLILPRLGLGPLAYMDWCKIYGKSVNKLCFLTFFSNFWPWRSNQRRMCGSWYWISMLALLNMGADCWTGHSEDEAWQQWHGMAWWGTMGTMEWSQWNNAIWCLHSALIDRRARHGKQQSEYWYFWFTLYHHIIMSWLTNFPSNLSLSTVCGDLPART